MENTQESKVGGDPKPLESISKPLTNPEPDKKVEMSAKQLNGLLQQMKNLQEQVDLYTKGGVPKPKKVKEHVGYVRFFEGRMIMEITKTWDEKANSKLNAENEKRLFGAFKLVKLGKDGQDSEAPITKKEDYLQFIDKTDMVYVKIANIKKQDNVEVVATGKTVNPDPVNNPNFNAREVEFEVNTPTYEHELEFLAGDYKGQKIKVDPSNCLNI